MECTCDKCGREVDRGDLDGGYCPRCIDDLFEREGVSPRVISVYPTESWSTE